MPYEPRQFADDRVDVLNMMKQPSGDHHIANPIPERRMSRVALDAVHTSIATEARGFEIDTDAVRGSEMRLQVPYQVSIATTDIDHATAGSRRNTSDHQIDKIHVNEYGPSRSETPRRGTRVGGSVAGDAAAGDTATGDAAAGQIELSLITGLPTVVQNESDTSAGRRS